MATLPRSLPPSLHLPPRCRARASRDDRRAEMAAEAAAAELPGLADHQHRRPRLPLAGRPRRRLRQGCRGRRRHARLRLRLRRGRDADAAAAGRQSAPAPVPAGRGPRRHQPHGLQQSRPGRCAGAAGEARPQPRHRRRQYRRQQGQRGPHRRLCRGRARHGAGRRLSDHQHQLAQHAGPAPIAGRRRAARLAFGGRRSAAGRRSASLPQGRAGPRRRRARPDRPRRPAARHRRHHRRQHHGLRARP